MAAASERVAAAPQDGAGLHQVLTFRVGREQFGVPILAVQEIRGWERAVPLPHAPEHVSGVIDLRGQVVPVVDVRRRFGMEPRAPDSATVLIVVQVDTSGVPATVALVVDAVSDVATLEPDSLREAPAVCGERVRDFVQGIARSAEGLLMLLDLPALVARHGPAQGRSSAPDTVGPPGRAAVADVP